MNPTDNMAESALGVTGIGTPGLNPHAQAEPMWLPVWTVDGDEARWVAKGHGVNGEWLIKAAPWQSVPLGAGLDIQTLELGIAKNLTVSPEQMLALIEIGRLWLASLGGGR